MKTPRFVINTDIRDGERTGHLRVDGSPCREDWSELHQEIRLLLKERVKAWQLDFTRLDRPDSDALGMIITLAATIENRGGRYEFYVKSESRLERLIQISKIDRIVEIRAA